ncbi:MAG: error-prone DNA polymerase, partial [Alphaproteobacteria bacterium]
PERDEPPDIDVDFEHERREEVIQYIYAKYGRERAGLAATVITYRAKSALRETGKALGLSGDVLDALSRASWARGRSHLGEAEMREIGLDPADHKLRLALTLARQIIGFPRHLSQHVGGFVITKGPLSELSPIANAAMADRTVIEWDKDDLDALGILKIDILGLGMLTCIRKAFDLIAVHHGRRIDLASVPVEDPAVYDMLCDGDSVGVFQVESRAQMSMLPRLKPRCFYDLVIEVAIVRPGPIQGNMVHPYLRRRGGEEPVTYPSDALRDVLAKTLGVPLFQEQAMRIAIVAGGFSPAEADKLRRAMATFRRTGQVSAFRARMVAGMLERGYERAFAEHCFSQIEGFGEYGFPESHAASFALLVYVSAWLKRHYPAAFACALLNSQPMGFYAPAQLVRDVRDHGVTVRPADVNHSPWDCALEPNSENETAPVALRLGLRQIKGLSEDAARRLISTRGTGYADPAALWRRAGLAPAVLEVLARADAFAGMGLDRRQALWAVRGLGETPLPLFAAAEPRDGEATPDAGTDAEPGLFAEPPARLPKMGLGEAVMADYAALRLSLRAHPLALLRDGLAKRGYMPAARLAGTEPGRRVRVAGLVTARQRPGTASGTIFVTLEDETDVANLIVWPRVFERFRRPLLGAVLLGVAGKLEREGKVIHVIVERPEDLSPLLADLTEAGARDTPTSPLRPRFPARNFH